MVKSAAKNTQDSATAVKESRDQLVSDLKKVIEDAQHLAEDAKTASSDAIHEKIAAARVQLEEHMSALRSSGEEVLSKAKDQADNLEEVIRKHPWRSVAVAAVAGAIIHRICR